MSDLRPVTTPSGDASRSLLPAFRVMVAGSRDWPQDEHQKVWDALDALLDGTMLWEQRLVVLHGGAQGPDSWAGEWANKVRPGIEVQVFMPDYAKHGKRAPHVRNDAMLSEADYVLAFWDGKSRGTKSVIRKAIKRGLDFEVYSPAGVYVEV